MSKAITSLFCANSALFARNSSKLCTLSTFQSVLSKPSSKILESGVIAAPRTHCTLSAAIAQKHSKSLCQGGANISISHSNFSTEIDKEISKFLDKEIQYENSRSSGKLPAVTGFDIKTEDADVTLSKTVGSEKIVVRLTVNGAIDSIASESQSQQPAEEPPQMVCRPPFEVELTKGDGTVVALQCSFPAGEDMIEETTQQNAEQIEDQFEIQEVAIHSGEWKDTTFSVSAATMDAELFDLLMDMLDERGINDEFIAQLVDYCTAYENQKYITFLNGLKAFAEK